MRRLLMGMLAAAALMAAGLTVPAMARAIAIAPGYLQANKTTLAEVVVTGQVVGMDDQDIKATIAPGSPTTQMYRIAIIQVTKTLKGKVEGNTVRVGFLPPQVNPVPGPGGIKPGLPGGVAPGGPAVLPVQPFPPAGAGGAGGGVAVPGVIINPVQAQPAPAVQPGPVNGPAIQPLPAIQPAQPPVQVQPGPIKKFPPIQPNFNVQLSVGNDGIFYLKKHHEGKFYILVPAYGSYTSTQNKDQYENEVATLTVTANPMAALKAANGDERLTAACVLIREYRTQQGPFIPGKGPVQQPISAEESKLILKALLEANWPIPPQQINYNKSAAQAFNQLGITAQDGFQQPINQGIYSQGYTDAAKAWLEKNWQTYQIKKFANNGNVGGPIGPGGPAIGPGGPVIQPFPVPPQPVPLPAPGGVAPGGAGQGGIGIGVAQPGIVQPAPAPVPVPKQLPLPPANN